MSIKITKVVKKTPSGRYIWASEVQESTCFHCGERISKENTFYFIPLNRRQKLFKSVGCGRCKRKTIE